MSDFIGYSLLSSNLSTTNTHTHISIHANLLGIFTPEGVRGNISTRVLVNINSNEMGV